MTVSWDLLLANSQGDLFAFHNLYKTVELAFTSLKVATDALTLQKMRPKTILDLLSPEEQANARAVWRCTTLLFSSFKMVLLSHF